MRQRPAMMFDIGSQAGHGPFRNTSDALLWLQHFHAAGSVVVGVDAFLDYALDLQHRFDHVEPYASMRGVTRQSLHAAIGTPWGCKDNASTSGDLFSSGEGCLFNLDLVAAFTNLYCSRTDWKDFFFTIERAGGISAQLPHHAPTRRHLALDIADAAVTIHLQHK